MKKLLLAATLCSLSVPTIAVAGSGCGSNSSDDHQPLAWQGQRMVYGSVMPAPSAMKAGYYKSEKAGYSKQATEKMQSGPNIVEVATSAGSFNTLLTAVKAAGLAETLTGKGPFTVFAPTDAAFAKLPEGTLEALLKDKEKLTQILTYHVVPGKLDSGTVVGMKKLNTVEGSELPVADIKIAKTDIGASNGIIHVIDEVLIPGV